MEEISLKELLTIILADKKLIYRVTAVFAVIGLLIPFFVPTKYRTDISLLTTPTVEANGLPAINLETYTEQILSNSLMSLIIEDLDLRDKKGEYLKPVAISSLLKTVNPKGTNIINVTIEGGSEDLVFKVGESLIKNFPTYMLYLNKSNANDILNSLETQMTGEENRLKVTSDNLKAYITSKKTLDRLTSERTSLLNSIVLYKEELNLTQKNIEAGENALRQIYNYNPVEDINIDDVELLLKDLEENQQEVQIKLSDSNKLEGALITLDLTKLKLELIKSIENEKSLIKKIEDLESQMEIIQLDITENGYKYNALLNEYELSQQSYSKLQAQYSSINLVLSNDINSIGIKTLQSAGHATIANSVSRPMYLAIAMVLGLMISVFAVLFKNYWNTDE